MDDDALAGHLAADLDGTFEAFVLAHQDRLYSIALRLLGQPGDAEEVAQDALLRAYRAMAGWEPDRVRALKLRPWLASIVVNLSRNRRRRQSERRPPLQLAAIAAGNLEPTADPARGPEAAVLRRDAAERWAVRLLRCPETLRAAVVLRHVDGLSYEETAEALGRPVGTVKAQVHRGVAHLRAQLELERRAAIEHEELTA